MSRRESANDSRDQSKGLCFHTARTFFSFASYCTAGVSCEGPRRDMSTSFGGVVIEEDNSATREVPSGDDEQGSNPCTSIDGEFT